MEFFQNHISELVAVLTSIAAILAWVSKIYWSKEFKEAKEAQIESLKQQTESLRQHIINLEKLTPTTLLKEYESTILLREKMAKPIEQQLDLAKQVIRNLEEKLSEKTAVIEERGSIKSIVGSLKTSMATLAVELNGIQSENNGWTPSDQNVLKAYSSSSKLSESLKIASEALNEDTEEKYEEEKPLMGNDLLAAIIKIDEKVQRNKLEIEEFVKVFF